MKYLDAFCRLCGIAAMGLAVGCQQHQPPVAAPRVVKLATVGPATAAVVRFTATVRNAARATLAFEGGGRIAEVKVDVGDHVRAGQVLARLDRAPASYRLQQAQAAVEAAQAELRDQQSQLARQQAQFEDGALSKASMAAAQSAAAAARAKLAAAQADVDIAQRAVLMTVIRAPFDGDVVARLQQPAGDVAPGQAVLQLEGEGSLQLVAGLPEPWTTALAIGAPARALRDTGQEVEVRLRGVSARSEGDGTRQALFDVVGNAAGLRSGDAVWLLLGSGERRVPVVPLASVVYGAGDRAWVYVYDPARGEVRRREVGLGARHDGWVEVRQGLNAGEQVVGAGACFMVDGQRVAPFQPETRLAGGVAP